MDDVLKKEFCDGTNTESCSPFLAKFSSYICGDLFNFYQNLVFRFSAFKFSIIFGAPIVETTFVLKFVPTVKE